MKCQIEIINYINEIIGHFILHLPVLVLKII